MELFKNISAKVANRPGGYTRIIKTGLRQDDAASMCFIELVDYDENMIKETAKKATRTRRSRKKSAAAAAEAPAAAAESQATEAPAETATAAAEAPQTEAAEAPKADAAEKAEDKAEA